jgi:hypothetical protein
MYVGCRPYVPRLFRPKLQKLIGVRLSWPSHLAAVGPNLSLGQARFPLVNGREYCSRCLAEGRWVGREVGEGSA